MPSLHLDATYLAVIKDLLKKHLTDCNVVAYGSRVKGSHHAASDLDLCVINKHNPNQATHNLATLKANFRTSKLPITVDVVDFASIPKHFQKEIIACHVKIV